MSQPFESTFVLFVDMLGFAALVEEQGDALDELSPVFTGAELYSPASSESLLGYRFINFHRCLNDARLDLQKLGLFRNRGCFLGFCLFPRRYY